MRTLLKWLVPRGLIPYAVPDQRLSRRGDGSPDLAVNDQTIDPHILPLVQALNGSGHTRTRASCEGHWVEASVITAPYVAFTADLAFAEAFDALLRQRRLNLYWDITAAFGTDRQLWYRLAAPTRHLDFWPLYPWEVEPWWRRYRQQVSEDVAAISGLVPMAVKMSQVVGREARAAV